VHGTYQQNERMDWMATSFMLRGGLSVVAVAVLLTTTHSIEWAAAGLIIANAGVLLLFDWRPKWLFRPILSGQARLRHGSFRDATRGLAIIGLPLGLAQMLNSFSVNIPRYVLERHEGEASLGIFAAIMYLLVAGRTVMAALAQSCVARLARFYANGNRKDFRSLLLRQLALAVVFGALGIVFAVTVGRPFLRVVYGPEYAEYTSVLLLAMFTSALNHLADVTGTALTAVRSLLVQPLVLGICVIIGIAASTLLIPRYGIVGAAWAVLLIGAFQLAFYVCALCLVFYRQQLRVVTPDLP
jgi:O-antigen/teichoic acid export membrane protein